MKRHDLPRLDQSAGTFTKARRYFGVRCMASGALLATSLLALPTNAADTPKAPASAPAKPAATPAKAAPAAPTSPTPPATAGAPAAPATPPADAAKPSPEAQKEEAKNAFKEGEGHFDKGDFNAAIEAFKKADQLAPSVNAKHKLAVSLDKLRRVPEAVAAYQAFVDGVDERAKADKKFDAKKYDADVADAKKRIEELKKTPATLKIAVSPPTVTGAMISVDGQPPAPANEVSVPPGKHTVAITAADFQPFSQDVEVNFGETKAIDATLVPVPAPPPPPPAKNKTLILAGFGVAGGLVLVGIGTGIGSAVTDANSKSTWTDNQCTRATAGCVPDFNDAQSTSAALGNTSWATLVVGGLLGGATAVYAFTDLFGPKKPSAPQARVVVTPGGVVVQGSF